MSKKTRQKIRSLSKNKSTSIEFEEVDDIHKLLTEYLDEVEPLLNEAEVDDIEIKNFAKKRKIELTEKITIDLHHLTVDEACSKIDRIFATFRGKTQKIEFLIVTGKGRHSGPEGAVLPKHVHNYVRSRYKHQIVSMESSPTDELLNGFPIRGHFKVILAY